MPSEYRKALTDAYTNLGLQAGGSPPPTAGEPRVTWWQNEERQTGQINIARWDGERFARGLREMLASHVDVVFADVDLTVTEDVDAVVAQLNRRGFFYVGLRPCAIGGHDTLCLQRLNSRDIELERIVCDSQFARKLLAYVREDRERVEQIVA